MEKFKNALLEIQLKKSFSQLIIPFTEVYIYINFGYSLNPSNHISKTGGQFNLCLDVYLEMYQF